MVAEHQPVTGKYFYSTTDQIGSTRIVTDDQGNMVYAAAHDPYGGVQQTWANAFEPEYKFIGMGDDLNFTVHLNFWINSSDKDQGCESGLYYFGARYYDPTLYRFLSPDPIIPSDMALYNPQRWNLYGYCGNNPISNIEVHGFYYIGSITIQRLFSTGGITYGLLIFNRGLHVYVGQTKEIYPNKINAGTYIAKFTLVDAYMKDENGKLIKSVVFSLILLDQNGNRVVWNDDKERYIAAIHSGSVNESNGCRIVDQQTMEYIQEEYNYCVSQYEKASYFSLVEGQASQVFYGLLALDWYSEMLAWHYFWVEIVDPPCVLTAH